MEIWSIWDGGDTERAQSHTKEKEVKGAPRAPGRSTIHAATAEARREGGGAISPLEGAPWLSPFLPSSPEAMCSFVQMADLSADDVILDVGCGDGRVLVTMAKVLGCRGIGIDVSQACISSAEDIGRAEGVSELLSWHCTDATRPKVLDELGLSVTTVVFLYAYPTLLAQLEVLLTRLRRGGARVFTLQYHLVGEGWEAAKSCQDEPSKRLYSALPP